MDSVHIPSESIQKTLTLPRNAARKRIDAKSIDKSLIFHSFLSHIVQLNTQNRSSNHKTTQKHAHNMPEQRER